MGLSVRQHTQITKEYMMHKKVKRRDFIKTTALIGGLSMLPIQLSGCKTKTAHDFLYTLPEYDIFYKFKRPKKLISYNFSNLKANFPRADNLQLWILRMVLPVFQGLINRKEPRIWLRPWTESTEWMTIYQDEGINIPIEEESDFKNVIKRFAGKLDGYIIIDPQMLHTINVGQTWGSLENWMIVSPELEPLVQQTGLKLKEDLRGRWPGRVEAYQWAYENLLPRCSKHVIGNYCVDYPYSGHFVDRDFMVANNAFVMDLSAALRQRREYRLMDKIYQHMEQPAGVWGWHDTRDHEHWAVERASRKGIYTLCSGMPNMSVHGGIKPKNRDIPKQKKSSRKNLTAEKGKIYIAFIMSDGDAFWVMENLQNHNWKTADKRNFPISWGFQPLTADVAPAVYKFYINNQKENDYMFCGPAGAGYTYTYQHPQPRNFLRYSKHYMQRCDLNIPYITNWNDYTNWQEVDVPEFNDILFKELDNAIGYVRGMGESPFEPNYNFKDKPYVTCGEGLHIPDKNDVATMRNFIEANPNRPLFIPVIINISVSVKRVQKIVDDLKEYDIDYVRLDDFMHLIKSAFNQGLITETLYPNRKGNEKILTFEAPAQWQSTKKNIERLAPALKARTEKKALEAMNSKDAGLALGQAIADEDKADVLAFELCKDMFALIKNVLNYKGIYVNKRIESVDKFIKMFPDWKGIDALPELANLWQNWDSLTFAWKDIVALGRKFYKLSQQADKYISNA